MRTKSSMKMQLHAVDGLLTTFRSSQPIPPLSTRIIKSSFFLDHKMYMH